MYVKQTLSMSHRFILAQLRLGIMPLETYTPVYDKYSKLNGKRRPSERVCGLCNLNLCEDEIHFLLIYTLYRDLRQLLIDFIHNKYIYAILSTGAYEFCSKCLEYSILSLLYNQYDYIYIRNTVTFH